MNIIIFQERYDPKPDANSICTKYIVDAFKKSNDNVYVLCDGVIGEEDKFSNDSSIIHVKVTKEVPFYQRKFWGKIGTLLKRCLSIPIWPIRRPEKVKKYVVAAEKLLSTLDAKERTIIISVYRPAEMVAVCFKLKKRHKDLKWFVYSLDGIDSMVGVKYSQWLDSKERKWNINHYAVADHIIQMRSNFEVYSKSEFSRYLDKTSFVDLPLVVKNLHTKCINNFSNDMVKILYGGAFYTKLREPYYLISWFRNLIKYINAEFICYTQSPFQNYFDQVNVETDGRFKRYNYILPDEMDIEISKSDLLINVGNTSSSMVPSKLFVYISACKPIIHFISDDSDSCLPYINKYPLALIIDQRDDVSTSVQKTLSFLNEVKEKNISYINLVDVYPENTPEHTVSIIKNNCVN